METPTDLYDLKKFRTLLTEGFTDDELLTLCFDVRPFRPVYDQLTDSTGRAKIVQKLLEYAEQKELPELLLQEAKERNPAKYKKYEPYRVTSPLPSVTESISGESQQPPIFSQWDPDGLEAYFTDVEHLRELFKTLVAAPALSKRLLIIHGVGGVGKSSLLRMFRLHCRRTIVPVGLASGDEAKSAVEVLIRWADDLKTDKLQLSTFAKTIGNYQKIQAKVEGQAKEARNKVAGTLGKAAAKTLLETTVSTIPVVGPLVSGLSGVGAEALVDWLGSFLKKPEIDLLLDPVKTLTNDFLADITALTPKRRLVLMLDTFEQMTTLEEWTRDLAQRLHPNVLLVVAGRAVPNWSRHWPGWLAQAELQELKPMTDTIMRELVNRYYATMRGGRPDPTQVETIITFARGLPIVVTSAVRLWVQYGVEDFQTVKPQVMADLVDRLQEGVPKELTPALEAAAAVRWFNNDILRAVTAQADVSAAFDELRRFPFTRPRVEGLSLHTAVREIIDDNLRIQDPARHRALHERAAAYFETRLVQTRGEEAERLNLERLYHRIRADEENGMNLFQEIAAGFDASYLLNQLRVLLNDVNTYPLEHENSLLWRRYYNTRLAYTEGHFVQAEGMYQAIGENEQAEPKLRAYALCDLGSILARNVRLNQPGGVEKALKVLERSQRFAPQIDAKLVSIFWNIRRIYSFKGELEKAIEFLEQQRQFFQQRDDKYGSEAIQKMNEALAFTHQAGDLLSLPYYLHNLGLALGFQARYLEAAEHFTEALKIHDQHSTEGGRERGIALGFWAAILIKQGSLDQAKEYLGQSLSLKEKFQDTAGMLEVLNWLDEIEEIKVKQGIDRVQLTALIKAEDYYQQSLGYRWACRRHFECGALTGLIRVKHAQADYPAIPPLLAEAEQLAQQYEYNDHLASLRLTQGHVAWDGHLSEWGSGFEAALNYYQQALIHALRYNRFLLDEVLWGGGVCTPLRPIIPHCQERGEDGRQMLAILRDWWQTGVNDIGVPRPDTISPIPEGIPLIEAERLARQREPGDGSPQSAVLQRLGVALG